MKTEIIKFLEKNGMYYKTIDFMENLNMFVDEMRLGLEGKESSLKMIPTYIDGDDAGMPEGRVIALDAGGTNLRVAVLTFDAQHKVDIEYFEKYPMPGTQGHMNKEEFFNKLADYVAPVLHYSDKIGFCFSYPTEIQENKDGRLMHFNKGVDVTGVNGELIGENLLNALKEKGYDHNKKIVLLNDTVATLLGGRAVSPEKKYNGNIGFILGTGTNVCYVEDNSDITKNENICKKNGTMIVNVESGGYDKVKASIFDDEFDKTTNNVGKQRFEKMIAGAYQGGLFATVIKKAHEEGILSSSFNVDNIHAITTKDINEFSVNPYTKNVLSDAISNEDDRTKVYYIAEMLIQRAAKLTAINIAATVVKTGKGKNPCIPVCIAAEGTTFYLSTVFKSKLEYYINKYMNDSLGVYIDIVKSENLTLVGTAIAGCI